ncbi:ribosome biogenesis protein ytm1 [Elasticomyces elasticus]|nr:ribosome biogenesis protein ytm1 [Elasticomyces elasticus]
MATVSPPMGEKPLSTAILESITLGSYPDSEDVASSELPPSVLPDLLAELGKAQEDVKGEIRRVSREVAPDVDEWISQAKKLQADIERSKATAREIVEQAEAGKTLKEKAKDAASKVALLEKEVAFSETLTGTLEQIKSVSILLGEAQTAIVRGQVTASLDKIQHADDAIENIAVFGNTRAYGLLCDRSEDLKAAVVEAATGSFNALIVVNATEQRITIRDQSTDQVGINLIEVTVALEGLNALEPVLQKLRQGIERVILNPRLTIVDRETVPSIRIDGDAIKISGTSTDTGIISLLEDVDQVVDYLGIRLPLCIAVPLSSTLVPALFERLIAEWLEPRMPISVEEIGSFQPVLDRLVQMAQHLDHLGLNGRESLMKWVESVPRTWLAKCKEAMLSAVKSRILTGLHDTKTVERVETQTVSKGDVMVDGGDGANDDWNDAWDERETDTANSNSVPSEVPHPTDGDDDASAWGLEDETMDDVVRADQDPRRRMHADGANDEVDEEAWGWNDEDGNKKVELTPPKAINDDQPVANGNNSSPVADERQLILKETYTVTLVPDGIIELIKQTIVDAEALSDHRYAQTPVAPAGLELYTLPNLALNMFRATASMSYSKLHAGNMLIYNDCNCLSDQLRVFVFSQSEEEGASPLAPTARTSNKLKLETDIRALDTFAKRAYSAEMEAQRTILRDLLDGAQGFVNCTVRPFDSECENAIAMAADRIREVSKQWAPILSRSALLQSLGSLLTTVTTKMIVDIEDLSDISEEESKRLRSFCDSITTLSSLFLQERPQSLTGGGADTSPEKADTTGIYCPNWFKFQYLAEIMESSLADIKYMWTEGELKLEFDVEEVVDLIQALFAESEHRRRAISEIRRSRR